LVALFAGFARLLREFHYSGFVRGIFDAERNGMFVWLKFRATGVCALAQHIFKFLTGIQVDF